MALQSCLLACLRGCQVIEQGLDFVWLAPCPGKPTFRHVPSCLWYLAMKVKASSQAGPGKGHGVPEPTASPPLHPSTPGG